MKQTPADEKFARDFGDALRPIYDRMVTSPNAALTSREFANRLGVTIGGLKNYLNGESMPSLRTVVRAHDEFGITIPYEGRLIHRLIKRPKTHAQELQLRLPLTVSSGSGPVELEIVEVTKKEAQSVQIELRVRDLGPA